MEDFESNVSVSNDDFDAAMAEAEILDANDIQNGGANPLAIGLVGALAGAAATAIGKKIAPVVKGHFAATKETRLRKKAEKLAKKQIEVEKELASFSEKTEEAK